MSTTVDQSEINRFASDAHLWWDIKGPHAPLHKINPARVEYIKKHISHHFRKDEFVKNPYRGLKIIDLGCGGGLVCEPLARTGAHITGIDADENAIAIARNHAARQKLPINYLNERIEDHVTEKRNHYETVLALEILEHVNDMSFFIECCAKLCKPGGLVVFSTINRTTKSYALGVFAAEKILRWIPEGTHEWEKFVRPSELANACRKAGLRTRELKGVTYSPWANEFKITSKNLDVNYFAVMEKPKKISDL
jgi:2-polyprenyl-6-hydroxyphenyl methylase/3-demethylubiquinone-9 3-methyltransferase